MFEAGKNDKRNFFYMKDTITPSGFQGLTNQRVKIADHRTVFEKNCRSAFRISLYLSKRSG